MDDKTETPITSSKKGAKTSKGKSEIVINPSTDDQALQPVNERVVDVMQRIRRGARLRRRASILKLKRAIARMRPHTKHQLAAKSKAIAKDAIRARFAGKRGASYHTLSPSDRMQVDKQIDPKTKLIHRIAARLMPRLRAADVRRLDAAMKGQGVKGIRSYMGNTPINASTEYQVAAELFERINLAKVVAERIQQRLIEGGPFGNPKDKPRKGSVAYNAAMRRINDRNRTPAIEPKHQQVGNAKLIRHSEDK